jgi:hypothetical protein
MDPLIARIVAFRSAPETYDPPSAADMMDRILSDAGRKAAARAREMNAELPAAEREVMALKGMVE